MAFKRYNTTTDIIVQSGQFERSEYLNSFTVTNIGDTAFTVNDKILFPSATPLTQQGDSISFGGNEDEIFIGKIVIAFQIPLGVLPRCEIIQKYFIDKI